MNDFNRYYLRLLRDQVEIEIKYLQSVGHDTKYPPTACIWCQEYKEHNMCNRLRELREFLSQIVVRQKTSNPEIENKAEFTTLSLGSDLLPENPNPF